MKFLSWQAWSVVLPYKTLYIAICWFRIGNGGFREHNFGILQRALNLSLYVYYLFIWNVWTNLLHMQCLHCIVMCICWEFQICHHGTILCTSYCNIVVWWNYQVFNNMLLCSVILLRDFCKKYRVLNIYTVKE